MRTTTKLTFRAEMTQDTTRAFVLLKGALTTITGKSDAVLKFNIEADCWGYSIDVISEYTFDEVKSILQYIPSGHVMVQTLNYTDKYDGERYGDELESIPDNIQKVYWVWDANEVFKSH